MEVPETVYAVDVIKEKIYMKYELIKDAMATDEGKRLYQILCDCMDRGLELTADHVKDVINAFPTYLGSEDHIARMVWTILNNNFTKVSKK